jgi:hypothetical protein
MNRIVYSQLQTYAELTTTRTYQFPRPIRHKYSIYVSWRTSQSTLVVDRGTLNIEQAYRTLAEGNLRERNEIQHLLFLTGHNLIDLSDFE